jgi:hypothetical protein
LDGLQVTTISTINTCFIGYQRKDQQSTNMVLEARCRL